MTNTMNLWQKFEIGNTAALDAGISFRYETGIEEVLKQRYRSFAKWLRNTYVFPVHLNVYIKNCEKVQLLNGNWAYGSFRWFETKPPYIRIPSKINPDLYREYSVDELYDQVLSSLVHELTHYFQWVLGEEQDDRTSERQANYFRYRIIERYRMQ